MSPHRESWWQRGGDNSRDQEAEPDEPECVRNDQRGNRILAAHDPEARQMYSIVTMPKAQKLSRTLSPSKTS